MDILGRLKEINQNLQGMKTPADMKSPTDLGMAPPPTPEAPPDQDPNQIGVENQEDLNSPGEEPPPIDDNTPPPPMEPEDNGEEPTDDDLELQGPPDAEGDEEPEDEDQPKERVWEPIKPPDGDMKSITFKSDKEELLLDMRRLDVIPRLWIARLYKNNKVIEHGQILLPKDVKDPITYIQALANAMLDNKSMRYEQEWQEYYANKRKEAENPSMSALGAGGPEGAPPGGPEGGLEDLLGGDTPEGTPEGEEDDGEGEAPESGESEDDLDNILKGV